MMVNYGISKPMQQVGAANDTSESALAEHWHSLDVMTLQQSGNFVERHVFVHSDHVARHHRGGGASMRLLLSDRLTGEKRLRLTGEERLQPRRTANSGAG